MESGAGLRATFIGSGNVATHLARAMHAAGIDIAQIASRDISHAKRLADEFPGTHAIDRPEDLATDVDYVVIASADDALNSIVERLPRFENAVVVHTSGSRAADVLAPKTARYGVLYPLQTFSRNEPVDVRRVPFFTEGSDADTLAAIDRLAALISDKVSHADSDKRRTLHIAGVFACNFPTFLWECAERILARDGYGLDVVQPLIEATIAKVGDIGPHGAQTGPARRGDIGVMQSHTELVPDDLVEVYRLLSNGIMKSHDIGKTI